MTHGTYDLYWIAVAPAARGRGVGHALLSQVEAEVQARGGRLLVIETSGTPAYTSARRLYESSGYRREAVIQNFYTQGDDLVIYAKETAPAQPRYEAPVEYPMVTGLVAESPAPAPL